ncbi:MAG: hypothetical protein ACPG4U_07405 [Pseudomonadales bacterium]
MQTQQERHQRLQTLGITSWLARATLPAAAASADWCSEFVFMPEGTKPVVSDTGAALPAATAQKVASKTVTSGSSQGSGHAREQAKSLSASLSQSSPAAELKKPATEPSELEQAPLRHTPLIAKSNREAPVMRLAFWQFEQVLVIDTLPAHSRGNQTPQQYQQLLQNMLLAMGCNNHLLTQPYYWNWPTLAGVSIDQGWDQALSGVQHKLAKVFQGYAPKLTLLLGEHAAQMVLEREDEFDALRGIVFSLRSETKTLTTYSLTQMLSIPDCKRDVWQDLQQVLPLNA